MEEKMTCENCIFAVPDYAEGIGYGFECQIGDAITDKEVGEYNRTNRCPRFERCDFDRDDVPSFYVDFAKWYNDMKIEEMEKEKKV